MTLPNVVKTGDGYPIHTLVESDGGTGLRMAAWQAAADDGGLTGGERIAPAAVAGSVPEGQPATDGPLPTGGVYKSSPSAVDNGDIVNILTDEYGRPRVKVEDGSDIALGSTGDAAITTDATGTISGKLRGIVKLLAERLHTSLGQKPMSGSLPVVIASDQTSVPVAPSSPLVGSQVRAGQVTILYPGVYPILYANSTRVWMVVCNIGGNPVDIRFTSTGSGGVRLASGERFEFTCWRGDVWGSSVSGDTTVSYMEVYT